MLVSKAYDAIIIGAGQAAPPLSQALAGSGWKVAVVERKHVGGTCINEGCTPTKTMVASARVAYLARRGLDYGVQTGAVSVDMGVVRQRKRDIVESFRLSGRQRLVDAENIDLIDGEASFVELREDHNHHLIVRLKDSGEMQINAPRVFVHTGARPNIPPIDGINEVSHLDSTSITELDLVPEHLIVLGGGYIGVEFGQMFRRFGSRVTIVQRGPQLLSREDTDIATEVARILSEDGIEIRLETKTQRVEQGSGGRNPSDGEHPRRRTPAQWYTFVGRHWTPSEHRVTESGCCRGRNRSARLHPRK